MPYELLGTLSRTWKNGSQKSYAKVCPPKRGTDMHGHVTVMLQNSASTIPKRHRKSGEQSNDACIPLLYPR